jgi:mono/diheme cytochrome c family protein
MAKAFEEFQMRDAAALCLLVLLTFPVAAETSTISWTWLPVTAAADSGKAEFERACAICHGAGPDRPGTNSLQIKYDGRVPALLEQRTDLTADVVRFYIRNGVAMMPRFRKTELTDAQVEAIARYLSSPR